MSIENYDPHLFISPEEYAKYCAGMDRELGMPKTPYASGEVGTRINQLHFDFEEAMRDELGWHGTNRAALRKNGTLIRPLVIR